MTESSFASLHNKLNFLLEDHGVTDFDETGLDLASPCSLQAKVNVLRSAHEAGH